MVNLLYAELLKLRRSAMLLISTIGASVVPFMVVVASYVQIKTENPAPVIKFHELFSNANLYTVLVVGVPLYGVVAAYIFNREYMDDTLKNLLTIPVSRINLILSKLLLLFIWIFFLTLVAWGLTLLLGVILQFPDLSQSLILKSFLHFSIGGILLFVLSTPIVLITVVLKNYVPTIIFTILITLINIMTANSEHRGLFPWAAAGDISMNTLLPTYPPEYSYAGIALISILGFASLVIYFNKADIH
ncbi:ABC transporter permease [Bacillus velezensis]|uniref:ABC transporter permease n=1 Tax=Bacillus TaxID=1386 RepID=UPI00050707C9|nr:MULTISPECIES: ABC transporter permease [Bacillus]ARM27041.1 bacitracin ABC transporter permease [Bacillus vallismortis]ANS37575.1 bacitracin ABC transporter permease [Bacillus velezensis]ANU29336.1 bacitracin ABC transporter permease [Bacillus velezensis]APQ49978.1 bacitracin ABC transporter permease [Bacillus amyloliquefaciens]AQZ74160.1 bacitracin ABC transporter permease [Bacillus velezensis]